MVKLFLSALFILGAIAQASTNNSQQGDLYVGQEMINEQPTNNLCYLYIDQVQKSAKGQHCTEMQVRPILATDADKLPKELTLVSRITNYHRPEYPQQKTCAMNTASITSGDDIYASDDSNLYNDILGWNENYKGNRLDFFISLDSKTKTPIRFRLHTLNWRSESNYDCIQLKKQ